MLPTEERKKKARACTGVAQCAIEADDTMHKGVGGCFY